MIMYLDLSWHSNFRPRADNKNGRGAGDREHEKR